MKKIIKSIFKILGIILLVVFAILLIIPTFFKDTIKDKVVEQANNSINATLSFEDFSLSLIRNFPNLSFRLEEVEIVGRDMFEGETLAGFKSFGFVFDLSSLFSKDGYTVKSIILDKAVASAIVLQDGTANWDIVKESAEDITDGEEQQEKESPAEDKADKKELKVNLEQIEIRNAELSYVDYSSDMMANLGVFDLKISGNFSESLTNLIINLLIEDIDVYMSGDRYINSAIVKGDFDIAADLENMAFTFTNNSFAFNDLILFMDGNVQLGENDIITSLKLASGETSFKSLLSLVPAFYMNDYKDIQTTGTIKLDMSVDGVFNPETGAMPVIDLILNVNDGSAWLKDESELMSDLNISTSVKVAGEKITGSMNMGVNKLDVSSVLEMMPSDTMEIDVDTTITKAEMELINVPDNIDFDFTAIIENLLFDPLVAEKVKSHILIRDSKIEVDNTGLETLGGIVSLEALYNTQDSVNPIMNASLSADNIGIKDSYESFNTVRKLAPMAKGMDGNASVLFQLESKLQQNMMPDLNSINGVGRFSSDEIQLVESELFSKFSTVLNLDDKLSNTFNDVDVEFRVEDGRVYFNDFDTELGNIGLTIGGDHGLDQTLNYMVSSAIPSSELPSTLNSLVSGLAAQAKLFGLEYTPPEVFNVNVAIGGTVKEPEFRPSLGKQGEGAATGVKESVKEMVEQKVDDVKDAVKEEVSNQAEKLMEEAEKQAEIVKSEAAKGAQLIRDEAAVNAQKLIDEASSKGAFAKIAAKKASDLLISEADKKALKLEAEAAVKADKILEEARKKADGLG